MRRSNPDNDRPTGFHPPGRSASAGLAGVRSVLAAVAVGLLTLSSCNVLFVRPPIVVAERSGLDAVFARPAWVWEVQGLPVVQSFRYAIDTPGDWYTLDGSVRRFQAEQPLPAGTHTFYLQAQSAGGLWSEYGSASVLVEVAERYSPNDTFYGEDGPYAGQWALIAMRVPELWWYLRQAESQGDITPAEVTVAVVDTGYTRHPEIEASLDLANDYDFIKEGDSNSDGTPDYYWAQDGDGIDDDALDEGDALGGANSWHGTTVAGVLAAASDNNEGISGVGTAFNEAGGVVSILPVRALGVGGGSTYDIVQSVAYAAGLDNDSQTRPANPAKVINLSLGAYIAYDSTTVDAYAEPIMQRATEAGAILVASAGNERGSPYFKTQTAYPAVSPYVISVGAAGPDSTFAYYSNPGTAINPITGQLPATLDVVAPGGDGVPGTEGATWVKTTSPAPYADQPLSAADYTYLYSAGTSIAAPHVAGVLALLCSVDDSMTLDVARHVLRESSVDLGPQGWDPDYGYGLVDALQALGAYNLVLSGDVSVRSADRMSARTVSVPRMSSKNIRPAGEVVAGTLIVRFETGASARSLDQQKPAGVRSILAGDGTDRLVGVDPTLSLPEARNQLLDQPGVQEVFYNYRYRPM